MKEHNLSGQDCGGCVLDAVCEQRGLLLHKGAVLAQPPHIELLDGHIIQQDFAALRFIKPENQQDDAAFAAAALADKRARLAGHDRHVEVAENPAVWA
jgi:hypothetical protein